MLEKKGSTKAALSIILWSLDEILALKGECGKWSWGTGLGVT